MASNFPFARSRYHAPEYVLEHKLKRFKVMPVGKKRTSPMQIYWFKAQGPRRVCTLAKHLGVDADYIEMDVTKGEQKSPGYLALNPNGRCPTLVDGRTVLWEALAISVYLCGKTGSDVWPRTAAEQAEVLRWTSWDAFHWTRTVGDFYFQNYVKPLYAGLPPDKQVLAERTPVFHVTAPVLEKALSDRDWLAANRLTLADIAVNAMLPNWEELEIPLDAYPNIRRWHESLMHIPAVRDPWPAHSRSFSQTQAEDAAS
jgi:glutathione S-transferase